MSPLPIDGIPGRNLVRLREVHVRDHFAPLLEQSAHGVVKLDLALRSIAALPGTGDYPGAVPSDVSWEQLHDLVRPPDFYDSAIALKRRWTGDKLARLESLGLIRKDKVLGTRPRIIVLSDAGDGQPFDDPGANKDTPYVTFLGSLIAHQRLEGWKSPQLAAYFAAMQAERYARSDTKLANLLQLQGTPLGGGIWYRALSWFSDPEHHRPEWHVRFPFSERTLRRGIRALIDEGLITSCRIGTDPRSGKRFENGYRTIYQNGFDDVRRGHRTMPAWELRNLVDSRTSSYRAGASTSPTASLSV
jgi:hypothetical protein